MRSLAIIIHVASVHPMARLLDSSYKYPHSREHTKSLLSKARDGIHVHVRTCTCIVHIHVHVHVAFEKKTDYYHTDGRKPTTQLM